MNRIYYFESKNLNPQSLEALEKMSVVKKVFSHWLSGTNKQMIFLLSGSELKIAYFHEAVRRYTNGRYYIAEQTN